MCLSIVRRRNSINSSNLNTTKIVCPRNISSSKPICSSEACQSQRNVSWSKVASPSDVCPGKSVRPSNFLLSKPVCPRNICLSKAARPGKDPRPTTLWKKSLWHWCFPVTSAKFLKASLRDCCYLRKEI